MPQRRRQRERQKSNRLNRQNNNSARAARFFVHFSAVTAPLRLENAQFHVNERRRNFLSLCKLRLTGRNSAPEWFGCIWQSKRIGIIAMEIERTHWFALQATFSWPSPSWYLKVGTDVPRGTVKQRRGWHERNLAGILRLSHSSS